MKTLDLIQGTPAWAAYRAQHFNASDAPAMMGCSPYKTRSQLLHELATGLAPEVDAETQYRFDEGHRAEALARPLAEQELGEDLYPVVGELGRLSASFDGITLGEDVIFEHKLSNANLRAAIAAGEALPLAYRVQMEQQLLVSGAARCLFVISRWTREDALVEHASCWYHPDAELRAQIVAGWEQFAADLENYTLPAHAAPAPTGRAPDSLPALRININGAVTASNLPEFKATALAAIASVNRDLQTDQDFADAEKAVKWCGEVESRLAVAKDHALSQTASIDELFRTMEDISAEARRVRLDLEKLVKARKEAIRGEIVAEGAAALRAHIAGLVAAMPANYMPAVPADFAGAVKGKRTVDSLRDAVATELARAKIAASEVATRIHDNLVAISAAAMPALFPDLSALVLKAPDDLAAVISSRKAAHEAAQAKRLEAERERIRADEQAKAQREAAATAAAAQQERERIQAALESAPTPPAPQYRAVELVEKAPKVGTVTMQPEPATDAATLKLGGINALLSPLSISAAGLAELGITHSATDGRAMLYRESDWPRICAALRHHLTVIAGLQAA